MSSWGAVFRFLVAFGGAMIMFVVAVALFGWIVYKLDELDRKDVK
jgi:uncharacterized membrane protein